MMDEIYIPLAKEVSGTTYEMVDRFTSYAEALYIVKDSRESFIAMAKHILKKTTKQHNDVDNLFSTLQKLTLILVEERLKQFPMTEFKKDRLPHLTKLQKQAAESKARTFDDVWIERIKHRSIQLRQKIEIHRSTLKKLITVQELCWKNSSKYQDLSLTLATSVQSRDQFLQQKQWPSEADVRSRERQIERLSRRLSIISGMVASCKSEYQKKVEYESELRNNLHKMSEDLCILVKNKIAERLAHGIKCLRDTVAGFNDVDRYAECLKLVGEINLPNIVKNILTASSDKYVCPRVNDYNEVHGFQSRLPAGKIVPGTKIILDDIRTNERKNKKKQCKPDEDEAKSQSQQSRTDEEAQISQQEQDAPGYTTDQDRETDYKSCDDEEEAQISQEEQDVPGNITDQGMETDYESCDDEEETSEAPPSGILQMRKSKGYVTVPEKVIERAPGLLKLKKGLRIKQKVEFNDEQLCFGWCRPRILSAKVWGFYYKGHVSRHILESDRH